MRAFKPSEIKALLCKDILVRWRQLGLTLTTIIWPALIFILLYMIRLKHGSEYVDECQYPSRLLPTKNQVIPSSYSYICSLENKCLNATQYEEYSKWTDAPLHSAIDVVNILVTDDRLYEAIIELPEKANFVSAVTTLITNDNLDTIRGKISEVIGLVPEIERLVDNEFDIKKVFSNRGTFVKLGELLCGHPFPSTESIPLVNDILNSQDFSNVNQDEVDAMPTEYCKQLYKDVTTTNQGKLTWNTIKPIIQGKILYTPPIAEVEAIVKQSNATFEEIYRLKHFTKATASILDKLHHNKTFQAAFDNLLNLARSPLVRNLVGDEFDIAEIERVFDYVRKNQLIYDVATTLANLMDCMSVDRFVPVQHKELQLRAYELNQQRMFLAALHFEKAEGKNIEYTIHMDTDNTQPTVENKNRFWFPGPADSMLIDLKYHRGFVQLMQMIDLGIIKHKRLQLGPLIDDETTTPQPPRTLITFQRVDDEDDDDEDDDDFDLNSSEEGRVEDNETTTTTTEQNTEALITDRDEEKTTTEVTTETEAEEDTTTVQYATEVNVNLGEFQMDDATTTNTDQTLLRRVKRQGFLDLLNSFGSGSNKPKAFDVDKMQFYTKQFPYPAYTNDVFKRGLYLAQAVQVAYCLGLVVFVAVCVRSRIWMRESRNSLLMRSMGLHVHSELIAWTLMSFSELCIIFALISAVLYVGGILAFTNWFVVMFYCLMFGACLLAFCYMCAGFFTSANIGAVAGALLFFITLCPYITVLLFDAHLDMTESILLDLSFTTAFAKGWSEIMRMELQENGISFLHLLIAGPSGSDCALALIMFIVDMVIYIIIGYTYQRFKITNFTFVPVDREEMNDKIAARLVNVTKVYGRMCVLSTLSLEIARGKVTCLLGRNGAGKSTVIKLLTGQCVPSGGQVVIARGRHNIGVCWQDNILIPTLTAREHLQLYARIKLPDASAKDIDDEVQQTLMNLNFGEHEKYRASQLSGGYQRRLCVAIAFIASPSVVILDEPCNGVDTKARKDIWQLIDKLRVDRAVIFSTHFLDEAKHLSDAIVVMRNGQIVAHHSRATVERICTERFTIHIHCNDHMTRDDITRQANELIIDGRMEKIGSLELQVNARYARNLTPSAICFLERLEHYQERGAVSEVIMTSSSLDDEFDHLDDNVRKPKPRNSSINIHPDIITMPENVYKKPLSRMEQMHQLLVKRQRHFRRNYRLLLYVLLLPALFELIAMWFVSYRVEDEFDTILTLNRAKLYPHSMEMLSIEDTTQFTTNVISELRKSCDSDWDQCVEFNNSYAAFNWIIQTLDEYRDRRFGGYGFNGTGSTVWYNNKGYHAMMSWLNGLNVAMLRTTLNDTAYNLTVHNEPWKLGFTELSTTSVLRQAGDSCMVFILLIAFGLVVAAASVYLVNERIHGEKLQQRLTGVSATTYWMVAFIWDYLIMIIALIVCLIIVIPFQMPVFIDRMQLMGIVAISLMFSFACVPAVHLVEKLFNDSSISIVSIFCANIIIPLFTMGIVLILGVVGDSPTWDKWRHTLNTIFLVLPQHALGDGLLEITKNFMVAESFRRYSIDSYKNPVYSDLLCHHFVALFIVGLMCILLNLLIEHQIVQRSFTRLLKSICHCNDPDLRHHVGPPLKLVSIQTNCSKQLPTDNNNTDHSGADNHSTDSTGVAIRTENLCASYKSDKYAVRHVNLTVPLGECFGLLGKNGAGKSTIFKLLTGQLASDAGSIYFNHPSISYCPQGNPLDPLLTVSECIAFYGRLRGIKFLVELEDIIASAYELHNYRHVLVKNLSGGNRRKLAMAVTTCGYTPAILLDEPTSDMDPLTRACVYRIIRELLLARRAILLTSHSIAEIEHLCQRISILREGQVVVGDTTPGQLKAIHGGYHTVSILCPPAQQNELAELILTRLPAATDLIHYPHSLEFVIRVKSPPHRDEMITTNATSIHQPSLVELFVTVRGLCRQMPARFAINCCRFDAIFEKVLDKSDDESNLPIKSSAVEGTLESGYIHSAFDETPT